MELFIAWSPEKKKVSKIWTLHDKIYLTFHLLNLDVIYKGTNFGQRICNT